ncbi:hypothetical protein COY32_02815, partial [candidate division WWE3 bacterium CG_4_10_14_0_2_um_filter_41_14]
MFISLGLIVAGYILASRDKQIVEPVFAGDPTYVSCMSNAMAPYMNALCGAKRAGELNGIKLLSPAWNVSNDTFEQFIPAMQAAGADFGCMDGIAVNIYNDGAAGGNNGDTWKIRQYINDKVRDYFQTEDLYLTETGMVETKRIQTPRPIAVANLKAELGALSVDDQIKALLIFNAFQTNPDSSFTHSYLSVNEIVDMCGSGGCGGKIGVNSARGFAQTFDYYDNLAASSSKFNLEIAEKDKAGATVQGINAALAKGAKTIVRIGIGDNGGGFYDVNNYIAYLKYLRQHTSGDFFAIAGPNEPDSETWIAPQCSGGTPPNDGGFDPDNPSNQPNTPICTIASPYVFGANVGHPGSLEEQNLVANAGGT